MMTKLAVLALAIGCTPAPRPPPPPSPPAPSPLPPPPAAHVAGYCFSPGDPAHPTMCEIAADSCEHGRAQYPNATPCTARESIYCAYTPDGDSVCGATEADCDSNRNLIEDTRGCGPIR